MRIGIDLTGLPASYKGGVTRFALGLATGFLSSKSEDIQYLVIATKSNQALITAELSRINYDLLIIKLPLLFKHTNMLLNYISWFFQEIRVRKWWDSLFRKSLSSQYQQYVDIIIVPTTTLNIYSLAVPSIVCIHDIQHEYYPENFSLHQRIARWAPYRLTCLISAGIQASSKFVKNCVMEKFSFVQPQRIFIAEEGVDTVLFSPSSEVDKPSNLDLPPNTPFFYYPAQMWRHKNHTLLVHALSQFSERYGFEVPCVLSGQDFGYWKHVKSDLIQTSLKNVFYIGSVNQEGVLWLYKNCLAILALGAHESSSLPLREGACFGKPLICSNIPPNIEASMFLNLNLFDVRSVASLCDALSNVYFNPDKANLLAYENIDVIRSYSWTRIVLKYIEFLKNSLFL